MQRDPFAVTAIAGFANPSRIDESSGRSLFTRPRRARRVPVFGSDRVVGAEIQAGRGLPHHPRDARRALLAVRAVPLRRRTATR